MNDMVTQQQQPNTPAAMAIYFDDRAFERASTIATRMAKADGFTPQHLIGKPDACFAVVEISLTWRLSPFQVAKATYRTPGGQIGFEGKLIQAIIENSGHLEPGSGGVKFEHYGDWSKIQGKFTKRKSEKGNEYSVATWTDEDAIKGGAGVTVRAHLRGEPKPRELRFDLVQAQPRNSTLWATDAKTQICYTAVRRFGSVVVPGLLMGVPFEDDMSVREIDMGDAVREPISMPRAANPTPTFNVMDAAHLPIESRIANPASPTGSIDKETGEVQQAPVNQGTLTDGQCKILRAKMTNHNVDEPEIEKMFGAPLERLPFEQFGEVQKFISGEK